MIRYGAELVVVLAMSVTLSGCGGDPSATEVPECDAECLDGVALLSLRETVKLVYNLTLQGGPVGEQDATTPCPQSGQARVFGTATSNAEQGTTEVELTYVLDDCRYLRQDEDADESYNLSITGTLTQSGIFAVQPNENTALIMSSESMSLEGTVYAPPVEYEARDCDIELGQDGDRLSGTLCGRIAGVDL